MLGCTKRRTRLGQGGADRVLEEPCIPELVSYTLSSYSPDGTGDLETIPYT